MSYSRNIVGPNQLTFRDGNVTRVAQQATLEVCSVLPQTAYLWAKRGLIDKPVWLPVEGRRRPDGTMEPGQAARRTFFIKEQIDRERNKKGLRRGAKPIARDCMKIPRGPITLIARDVTMEECGVLPSTVALWAKRGWIDKGEWLPVAGGKTGPFRRMFHRKDQIDARNKRRIVPRDERPQPRSASAIVKLHDDDCITIPEMVQMGIPYVYARKHWDYPDARRRAPRTPCSLIGRIIQTKRGERVSDRGHIVAEPLVRWGDVREALHARDNPPAPEGGVLLRDAVRRLGQENIAVGETRLRELIAGKLVDGGKIRVFKRRNLQPMDMWWMRWADRTKIRQHDRPGNRCYWINGEDYHPLDHEAAKVAGLKNPTPLRRRLKEGLLTARKHAVTWRSGEELTVCRGEDLRDIAEKMTGVRPKAPPKPPKPRNPGKPSDSREGSGHVETIISHIDKRHREHVDSQVATFKKLDNHTVLLKKSVRHARHRGRRQKRHGNTV